MHLISEREGKLQEMQSDPKMQNNFNEIKGTHKLESSQPNKRSGEVRQIQVQVYKKKIASNDKYRFILVQFEVGFVLQIALEG